MHLPVKATKLGRKLYWESSARIRRLPNATSTTETPEGVVTTVTGPALIEPNWGYVITAEGRLLEDSLRTNWRAPAPWRFATPDPHEFNRVRHKNSPEVRDFEEVVLLRDLYEWNYFHFHFDVLGRLGLLREYGIPTSTPIIVGRYAKELPFVQQMLSTGRLAEWQMGYPGSILRSGKNSTLLQYVSRILGSFPLLPRRDEDACGSCWI